MQGMLGKIQSLTLVGCGNMGGALLRGWLGSGLGEDTVKIVNPSFVNEFEGIKSFSDVSELDEPIEGVIVLAVKPQVLPFVLAELGTRGLSLDCLLVSVAAGPTIKKIQKWSGHEKVIRIMPNTGAALKRSVTCAFGYKNITAEEKSVTDILMEAVGQGLWLDHEEQMDAVTAISGCGPAYVFYFAKMLEKAACDLGLTPEISDLLVRQTIVGAAHQLDVLPDCSADALIQKVASPGGSTEAGLRVLTSDNILFDLLHSTVTAARDRSLERKNE